MPAVIGLLLSTSCPGQVKYVDDNKGATMFSASYSSSLTLKTMGVDIDYSSDGHFGIGALYGYSYNPRINTLGFQAEYAVLRPKDELGVGANLDAAAAVSRLTIQYPAVYMDGGLYTYPPYYLSGRSAALGGEVYLHTPITDYRLEPFVQFARTFEGGQSADYSPSSAVNSLAVGSDILLGSPQRTFVVFTIGLLFQQQTQPALGLNLSFVHSIK
jgi:hypothetical protein